MALAASRHFSEPFAAPQGQNKPRMYSVGLDGQDFTL